MAREEERERFIARTDDGKTYTIVRYDRFVPVQVSGPRSEIAGKPRFATSTGLEVKYINPETFEIVETGEVARTSLIGSDL